MLKIPSLLAISALALALGFATTASAGTLNDDFNVTLNVPSSCSIEQAAADVVMTHANKDAIGDMAGFSVIVIQCNADLPYTIGVDTDVGGAIVLTDDATSKTVGGSLHIQEDTPGGYVGTRQAWGSVANSEALGSVGAGTPQSFSIDVSYDSGSQPAVGVYTNLNNITIDY